MINEIKEKMILTSDNPKDVHHFLKVHSFACAIAFKEVNDLHLRHLIEIEALVHDISCPLCRVKYHSTDGHYQEIESEALLIPFLEEFKINEDDLKHIIDVVSHHHTYSHVAGLDHQILLEADFLVNSYEMQFPIEEIKKFRENVFKTETGITILNSLYKL